MQYSTTQRETADLEKLPHGTDAGLWLNTMIAACLPSSCVLCIIRNMKNYMDYMETWIVYNNMLYI